MRQDRGSRSATARNATGCCAQHGWRKNSFRRSGAIWGKRHYNPGTGGVFVINGYDGEVNLGSAKRMARLSGREAIS